MGLAWQQGPFGESPSGQFLLEQAPPEHILYAEPACGGTPTVGPSAQTGRCTSARTVSRAGLDPRPAAVT